MITLYISHKSFTFVLTSMLFNSDAAARKKKFLFLLSELNVIANILYGFKSNWFVNSIFEFQERLYVLPD